jgi:hypothetical protein
LTTLIAHRIFIPSERYMCLGHEKATISRHRNKAIRWDKNKFLVHSSCSLWWPVLDTFHDRDNWFRHSLGAA